MQKNSVSWTEPTLCHYDYDMTKSWFVYFDFTDKAINKTVRKQYRNGINYAKSKQERIKLGNALVLYFKKKLESGWSPFRMEERAPTDTPATIREAINMILQLKKSSLKGKSIGNYEDITNMFLKWCTRYGYDSYPLHKFTGNIAQAYMDYLLVERKYSGKSHNGQLGILKAICSAMVGKNGKPGRWSQVIQINPFAGIESLPESVGRNVAYTEEEARALMQWYRAKDIRLYYAASIMFHCYIRKTELSELRVRDINWTERTIIVNADSAKNRTQESVTIPEGLVPILEEMKLRTYPPDYYIFGKGMETTRQKICKADVLSDRHLLAVNAIRKPKDYKIKSDQLKVLQQFMYEHEEAYEAIRRISYDKTFYSWKHTGVVMYWQVVKDVYYMMRQLRHREMATTMVYLKSLGLMPNEAFRNASISVG